MCTVTYCKIKDRIVLTSNRDEHIDRPLAIAPKVHHKDEQMLYYPQDPQGGGTWFCVNASNEVIVLLNGGSERHAPLPSYRKSRGLIVLDLFQNNSILDAWHQMDLKQIEPFTIVAFAADELHQLQWNGDNRLNEQLNIEKHHIWSSTTLYDEDVREMRKSWFEDFIQKRDYLPSPEDLIAFHTETKTDDSINGLIINRDNQLVTKNVTQSVLSDNGMQMTHHDLMQKTTATLWHTEGQNYFFIK